MSEEFPGKRSPERVEAEMRALPKERRLELAKQLRWISYPRAEQALSRLETMLTHPRLYRMPNFSLIGEANNGKSMILERFRGLHTPADDDTVWKLARPVVIAQTTQALSVGRLYNRILEEFNAEGPTLEPTEDKYRRLKAFLAILETRILAFDNFQNLLAAGPTKLRILLNAINVLGAETRCSIVIVGTPEVLNAIEAIPGMNSHFPAYLVARWALGTDFTRLLLSYERILPLATRPRLSGPRTAAAVLEAARGRIGEVSTILRLTAQQAIESGTEEITLDQFSAANLASLGHTATA
jgi:Bacterial TniB protein